MVRFVLLARIVAFTGPRLYASLFVLGGPPLFACGAREVTPSPAGSGSTTGSGAGDTIVVSAGGISGSVSSSSPNDAEAVVVASNSGNVAADTDAADGRGAGVTDEEGGSGACMTIAASPSPDPFITDSATTGSGACTGKTLQQVIEAVYAIRPDLVDITRIYSPGAFPDGSFIYAFASPGGFRLVFVRGGGDCPAGCTEHEYWYFQTGASCVPTQTGQFHPNYSTNDSGCPMYGAPMWAVPPASDPIMVCGADNAAQDISGSYTLCVNGISYSCDPKGASAGIPFHSVKLTVAQNAGDLSKGMVTLSGTGVSRVDGAPLNATFVRRRFNAALQYSNLPSKCPDEYSVSISVDFEGYSPPSMRFAESHAVGTCPPLAAMCKGETHF